MTVPSDNKRSKVGLLYNGAIQQGAAEILNIISKVLAVMEFVFLLSQLVPCLSLGSLLFLNKLLIVLLNGRYGVRLLPVYFLKLLVFSLKSCNGLALVLDRCLQFCDAFNLLSERIVLAIRPGLECLKLLSHGIKLIEKAGFDGTIGQFGQFDDGVLKVLEMFNDIHKAGNDSLAHGPHPEKSV